MRARTGWLPDLESPATVRRWFGGAALFAIVMLVYASLVPLDFRPLSWEETRERWEHIPWLHMELYERADWIASVIAVMPAGALAAAAIGWGRSTRGPLLLAIPLIVLLLAAVVIGIELVQVWFPPRTVSLNDIAAGCVGAVLGPLVWLGIGPLVERRIEGFLRLTDFKDRLNWLCIGWLVAALIYSVLPLDLVVTRQEWAARLAGEGVQWNPFSERLTSDFAAKDIALAAIRMLPVGLLLGLHQKPRHALWGLLALPVVFELIQLPFYSKYVTTTAVIGGWIGGALGYLVAKNLRHASSLVMRPRWWALAWTISVLVALGALLFKHDQILTDPTEIAHRLREIWRLPLVNYYAGSKYNAYTSILEKMALFAAIGGCAFGWQKTSAMRTAHVVLWLSLVTVIAISFAIAFARVFLPPLVPDISDVVTYLAGYAVGYQITRTLWVGTHVSPQFAARHPERARSSG